MKYLNGSRKEPTEAEIREVEFKVGSCLHRELLEFFKENNGGSPKKEIARIGGRDFYVSIFFLVICLG